MISPTVMTQFVLFQFVLAPTIAIHKHQEVKPKDPPAVIKTPAWKIAPL